MLFLVFGIAHPEQFINRPVLIAIDRVEHGLSWCEGPKSAAGTTWRTKSVARTELLGQSPGISPGERRPEDLPQFLRRIRWQSVVSGWDQWQVVNLRAGVRGIMHQRASGRLFSSKS